MERSHELEKERDEWIAIAKRVLHPYHDDNCEYSAPCTYCMAVEKVDGKIRGA
jgi:hypothetical protein